MRKWEIRTMINQCSHTVYQIIIIPSLMNTEPKSQIATLTIIDKGWPVLYYALLKFYLSKYAVIDVCWWGHSPNVRENENML